MPGGPIRRLRPEDADELVRVLTANRTFLAPYEPEWPGDFLTVEFQRARIEAQGSLYGIVDGGVLVGTIALSNIVHGAFRSANLGYWVAEASNGRGLATRAVGAILDVAFTRLELHRVEAGTLVDNVASQCVLEKNRFARIGIARRYLRIAGVWRDHVLFQRTVDD